MGHLDRLVEMSLDMESKNMDALHVAKVQKWAGRVVDANGRDGEKCDATVDDADDMMVFDGEDGCKLNSQIMSALRSFARKYACNGRGNVPRQITRRSRRLEENFERRKFCEPETTEAPTTTTSTTTSTTTTTTTEELIEPPVYSKSPGLMTYSEAVNYCRGQGMEIAPIPRSDKNPLGYQNFLLSITE